MRTPEQHRRESVRLLSEAESLRVSPYSMNPDMRKEGYVQALRMQLLARAQVHATLATETERT